MGKDKIKVFVSYSHQDAEYLRRDSLLGFLEGLRHLGVRIWTDRSIPHGDRWDDVIRGQLSSADIALLLVSQAFLDSEYIRNVELSSILKRRTDRVVLPVLLSPCNWQEHVWLSELQFLPRDGKSIEEDYVEKGRRKRLYSQLRSVIAKQAREIVRKRNRSTAKAGERRRVATARCELRLDGNGGLDADEEAEIIQFGCKDFEKTARQVADLFNGHMLYLPPEVIFHFGYPNASENASLMCATAVLELSRRIEQLPRDDKRNIGFSLRGGMDFGRVVVDTEGRLMGRSIDEANRLRLNASTGQISATQTIADLVGHHFILTPLPAGDGHLVSEASREAIPLTSGPLLLGREEELALLSKFLKRSGQGEGRMVLVRGERGIGKTRLLEALRNSNKWKCRDVTLFCSPLASNDTLFPLVQYIEQLVAELRAGKDLTRTEAVSKALSEAGLDDAVSLPAIEPLLHKTVDDEKDLSGHSAGRVRRDLLEALTSWILALAQEQTVLLILEDAQWADPSTIELLTMLLDYIQDVSIMVVVTSTNSFPDEWTGIRIARQVQLGRLSNEETAGLIKALDTDKDIPKSRYSSISYATDGIPLFIEEYVGMLIEENTIDQTSRDTDTARIPVGLDGLLAQRLDMLGPAKIGAQLASVIGYEFGERFYFELAEKAGVSNPEEKLTRCVGSGVVRRSGRPGHNRYTFRHGLLRDAAYASIIRRDRRRHHRIIADLMIREGMGHTDPSAVGYHLTKSGHAAAALPFMHQSAKRHVTESANREALSDLDQALALVPGLPQEERAEAELALLLDYGAILVALKGYGAPEMVRTYARACELCRTVGEPSSLMSAHWGAWAFYIVRGDFRTALDLSLEIERIAAYTSSSAVVVESRHVVGVTHFNLGRFGDAVKQFDAGLNTFAADHGDEDALSQGQDSKIALLCWKALSLTYLGDFSSALSSLQAAIDRAENIKHRLSEVFARTFSAIVIDAQHEFEAARRKAAAASRLAEEETFGYWQAWNDFLWGVSESSLKVTKTSLARTHSAIREYAKTGAKVWLPYMIFRFARDLSRMGRETEAETVLDRGKQLLDGEEDRYYFADICCFEAEILLDTGRETSAIALLENGWRVAMQQSNLLAASHILNAAKRFTSSQGMKQRKDWQEEIRNGMEIPSSISHLY